MKKKWHLPGTKSATQQSATQFSNTQTCLFPCGLCLKKMVKSSPRQSEGYFQFVAGEVQYGAYNLKQNQITKS